MVTVLLELGRQVGSLLLLIVTALLLGVAAVPAGLLVREVHDRWGDVGALAALPLAYGVFGATFCVVVVVLKRGLFLRLRPGRHPLVSPLTAKWAAVGYLVAVAHHIFVVFLRGTPFIVWWCRGLGATIGARTLINTANLGDFDLLRVGDDCIIGAGATILCHVGEQGELRMAPVIIGDGCTVGLNATVMPGCVLEAGAVLGAHGLAIKDSVLTGGAIWGGAPAVLIKKRSARGGGPG